MAKKYCPNHPTIGLWAKGVCINCYRKLYAKPLKKTPIAPISEKQKNILTVYRLRRRQYLSIHPTCEIQLEGCTIVATEIHHSAKKYTSKLWLDLSKYKACCRNCHSKIENSPKLAKSLGIYNFNICNEEDFSTMDNADLDFVDAFIKTNRTKETSIFGT